MNIVFFGSGRFAMSLAQRIHAEYGLSALIVTKPKPRGRGRTMIMPRIATWAEESGIRVFTPDDPNASKFISVLSDLKPDLFILASYGHILGNELLNLPRHSAINVHPSLLPRYRGAAPVQRAIMAGDSETGVTVIIMDERIDHGDIIFQQPVAIEPDDTYGTLLDRLSGISTGNIGQIIRDVEQGDYTRMPQDHTQKSYAQKIKKEETVIRWDQGVEAVHNLVRALSPAPAARTAFRGKKLKVMRGHKGELVRDPGITCYDSKQLAVGTGDGSFILDEVQPADRSMMTGVDFRNGYRVQEGEVMS